MTISERRRKILAAIVEQYIRTGEPVGSKTLAENAGLNASSATIRNDMAELFDMGLLEQPHTSAGRVPSHMGYRLYIDDLMRCKPLSQQEKDEIDALFNVRDPDPDRLLEDAANALAYHTNCASIAATVTPESIRVRRIDIVPIDARTAVLILVATNGTVKNKVCRTSANMTPEIFEFFRKFATDRFCGRTLHEISSYYVNSVAVSLGEYSRIFTPLLISIYELCREVEEGQFYVSGETNLLAYQEFAKIAHDMLALITSKHEMTDMLNRRLSEVDVIVGKENTRSEMTAASVVVAKYNIGKDNGGALGVIGPIRLDYSTLIPHLEYFASKLGKLMNETLGQEQEPVSTEI